MPGLKVKAQEYCTKYSDSFHFEEEVGKVYKDGRYTSYNATLKLSNVFGDYIEKAYAIMFGDNFTVEECDDADCLHPCYGASHERYCN